MQNDTTEQGRKIVEQHVHHYAVANAEEQREELPDSGNNSREFGTDLFTTNK